MALKRKGKADLSRSVGSGSPAAFHTGPTRPAATHSNGQSQPHINPNTNMKTLKNALLISSTILALAPVRAEESEAVKKDLAALQGEWAMVSGSADGQAMPDEMRKQMK